MEQNEYSGREVVEIYRHPQPREVVETYSRPLPWLTPPQPSPAEKPRRKKRGLWIFAGCFAVIVLLSAGGWLLTRFAAPPVADDEPPSAEGSEDTPSADDEKPSSGFWEGWYSGEFSEHFQSGPKDASILIPTFPTGQGVTLEVLPQRKGRALTIQEIYQKVNPSTVTVVAYTGDGGAGVGTGVIFTEDGYVLTNHHVVEGGQECTVILSTGYSYNALYVAGNAKQDLAVLKIEDADGLPAAEFGDSDDLLVGDPAYAIGNPLGMELRGTLTNGIISAINRDVWVDDHTMTLLQTNAALNEGNSGGPLINQYGQVVGINVIKMDSAYSTVEGLGFAIPSSYIKRMVNDLLSSGEIQPEPLLGISVLLNATEAEKGIWGLEVESVTEGSAADLAGVKKGDFVLSADGEPLATSQDLLRVRRRFYLGDEMPMTIWRNGKQLNVVLKLTQAAEN